MFELQPSRWTATRTLWLVWTAVLAACALTGEPADKCIFGGVARDQSTHLPISKVLIRLIPELNKRGYSGSTDESGAFRFEGVNAGDYIVDVERSGYSREPVLTGKGGRPIGRLHLGAGQTLDGNELWLLPESSVTGKVVGPDGEPLADVQVSLIGRKWQHGKRVHVAWNRQETDDAGFYRFQSVAPGSYFVHAGRPTHGPLAFSVLEAPGKPEMRVAGRYYPNSQQLEGAGVVDVRAGEEISGIDLRLPLSPVFHVRGSAESPSATMDTKIALYRQENGEVLDWEGETAAVGKDNGFDFSGVAAGRYFLYAVQSNQHAWLQGARTPVTVEAEDVGCLMAPAVKQFQLTGHVRVENRSGPEVAAVLITCEGRDADQFNDYRRSNGPDEDSKFLIPDLTPDRYTIRVENMPAHKGTGLYLKSVHVNGLAIEGRAIDMTAGAPSDVELIFRADAGSVEGTVVWPEKEPAGNLKVVVVPEAAMATPQMTIPDQEGHFRVIGLAPGRYRAFAVTLYDKGLWQNADFLRQALGRGTLFEAAEKESVRVEIQVLSAADIRRMEDQVP